MTEKHLFSSSEKFKNRVLHKAKKASYLTIFALLLCAPNMWARDVASFVDLGFSPDGKVYMFAQYGVQTGTLRPWADLFIVDVPKNDFVRGGRLSFVHDGPVVAGQDGSGALFRLIARNAALAERYDVGFLCQGYTLYIAMDRGISTDRGETIEFRDFRENVQYKAQLVPTVEGIGANLTSSFYINFEQTGADGVKKTYTVGNPQIKRPLINSYRIQKVMVAPEDGSVIFVVAMRRDTVSGRSIRYMVEALRM